MEIKIIPIIIMVKRYVENTTYAEGHQVAVPDNTSPTGYYLAEIHNGVPDKVTYEYYFDSLVEQMQDEDYEGLTIAVVDERSPTGLYQAILNADFEPILSEKELDGST